MAPKDKRGSHSCQSKDKGLILLLTFFYFPSFPYCFFSSGCCCSSYRVLPLPSAMPLWYVLLQAQRSLQLEVRAVEAAAEQGAAKAASDVEAVGRPLKKGGRTGRRPVASWDEKATSSNKENAATYTYWEVFSCGWLPRPFCTLPSLRARNFQYCRPL